MSRSPFDLGPLDPAWVPDGPDLGTMDTLPQHFQLVNGANCDPSTPPAWVQDDGMTWQRSTTEEPESEPPDA